MENEEKKSKEKVEKTEKAVQLLEREDEKENIEQVENKEETEEKEKIEIKTLEIAKEQELKDEKEEQEEQEEVKKKSKINIVLITIGIIVIIVAVFSTIFSVININNENIIKGVSISGIDVSDKSKEDAIEILKAYYSEKMENQIYLKHGEYETAITYKALEVEYQIETAVKEAYEIGRIGNIFEDNIQIIQSWTKGFNINVEIEIDQEMIGQISQNINNNIDGAVVQSSYYIEDKDLIITSGKEGIEVEQTKLLEEIYKIIEQDKEKETTLEIPVKTVQPKNIDIEKIHEEVYKAVQDAYYTQNPFAIYPESKGIDFDVENAKTVISEPKDEYTIPLIITNPKKTVQDIGTAAFPDKLATFSTKYQASNVNRTTNLRLAANKINGKVLLPGEEFSYNKVVGERTIQAGYKEAAMFANGEVVDGLGGGICQISSTLYDAVVMANLKITHRRNHQFVTSYVGAGKDATVVYGSQDFKFVNTRNYPVRIEATVSGGIAKVTIWGLKEDVEYDISIQTKKIATIAYTTQYIQDPSLPAGTEVVKQAGSNGSKVQAYKVMKQNGKVVSSTLLSTDTYSAKKKIVRVGTGN